MIELDKEIIEIMPDSTLQYNVDIDTLTYTDDDGQICNYTPDDFEYKFIDHFCNGSKLTNMDAFIEVRQEFDETGKYCNETRNLNKASKYRKFWDREIDRCKNGYHAGHDEIPGYLYWYWNYTRMLKVKDVADSGKTGKKRGERIGGFPDIWDGDYYWFWYMEEAERRGQHAANIKSRGQGYSIKAAAMGNRNFYLCPESKSYFIADNWGYLTEKDGVMNKVEEQQSFLDQHTEFRVRKDLKNTLAKKKAWYKVKTEDGRIVIKGLFSEIIGISLDGNADNVRGIRGKLALFEESGNNKCLKDAWEVSTASFEEDDTVYGLRVAWGTGGSEGARFEALEDMIRNPHRYNIYGIPNVFERGRTQTKSAMFIGKYMNYRGLMDENGNSDTVAAILKEQKNRKKYKDDPNGLMRHAAENPLNIEEAVYRKDVSIFDVPLIKAHKADVETNPKYKGAFDVGHVVIDGNGECKFKVDPKANPVLRHPNTIKDPEGAIVIYEHPSIMGGSKPADGLYIAGCDPVDHDRDEVSTTYSMASTFIYNRLTRRFVAEYTARTRNTDTYYENLKRLLMYYNARCLYEANIKGLYVYFENNNCTHLLADEPKILQDIVLNKTSSMRKGYKASKQVNSFNRTLLHKWSISNDELWQEEEESSEGKVFKYRPLVHNLRCLGLLDEMEKWTPEGNFDRVSAAGAVMLLEQEMDKIEPSREQKTRRVMNDKFWGKAKGMDSLFDKNAIMRHLNLPDR